MIPKDTKALCDLARAHAHAQSVKAARSAEDSNFHHHQSLSLLLSELARRVEESAPPAVQQGRAEA